MSLPVLPKLDDCREDRHSIDRYLEHLERRNPESLSANALGEIADHLQDAAERQVSSAISVRALIAAVPRYASPDNVRAFLEMARALKAAERIVRALACDRGGSGND